MPKYFDYTLRSIGVYILRISVFMAWIPRYLRDCRRSVLSISSAFAPMLTKLRRQSSPNG